MKIKKKNTNNRIHICQNNKNIEQEIKTRKNKSPHIK